MTSLKTLSRKKTAGGTMSSTLRCLQALERLAAEPFEYGLSEMAAALSLPKASAHRLLATLCGGGFVEQDAATRHYRLAGKALWVGTGFLRHSAVYRSAFTVMQELAGRAEGMVHLAVWDNDTVLYLHTIGHPSSLYLFADVGERRPVHCTALGKVLLAHRSPADAVRLFSHGVERHTETTIMSLAAMKRELDQVRRQDYAVDNEEGVRGLRCLAAPIRNHRAEVVAGLSVSAAAHVLSPQEQPRYAALVREAALRVSVQLGFRPRTSNLASLISA
jgi:DNA-binding IclR family transcriptional regulator